MVTVKKRKLSQAVILSCLPSAKRARQIIAGDMPLVEEKDGAKPLSTAVEELWEEKVKILGDDRRSRRIETVRKTGCLGIPKHPYLYR